MSVLVCPVGFVRGGAQREATAAGEAAGCAAERVTYWAAGATVRGWASTGSGREPAYAAFRRVPLQGWAVCASRATRPVGSAVGSAAGCAAGVTSSKAVAVSSSAGV